MLTDKQLWQLNELQECQGHVDADQYDEEEKKIMEELARLKLCVLSWEINPKGIEELKKEVNRISLFKTFAHKE